MAKKKMKTYSVYAVVVGSKYLGTYQASSEEEAEKIAVEKKGYVSFCHKCAEQCEDPEITKIVVEEASK